MMTTGPKARVGGILAPTFPRPRIRQEVLDSSDYYTQREELIEFLESQDKSHRPKAASAGTTTSGPGPASSSDSASPRANVTAHP